MRDGAYWAKLLPVITALVNGKECQFRNSVREGWQRLTPTSPIAWYEDVEYRIKPTTVQYRRYFYRLGNSLCVGSLPNVPDEQQQPKTIEREFWFVKWIDTEWQEIELPSSTETGG